MTNKSFTNTKRLSYFERIRLHFNTFEQLEFFFFLFIISALI